jgi:hypothetical protein
VGASDDERKKFLVGMVMDRNIQPLVMLHTLPSFTIIPLGYGP